ncbi:MAG TPA: tetratricopeptide repeat protein [Gaiellaceae bacterium]|nr:tetratricopeptide repeat protein [Gaiellaceae bacterium]
MKTIGFIVLALAAASAVLFGGTLQESRAADPRAAERVAIKGLQLQQQARATGNPTLYPRVERELRAALELEPRSALALRGLAALAASRHRFSESLELAEQARALEPQVAAVYGLIGDANLELGRYSTAFAAFERMAKLKPTASAYSRVSYARELLGDLVGAIEAMELAVDASIGVAEPSAWSRTLLAHLLISQGRVAAAETRLREALAFVPSYPAALAGLAGLAARRGDLAGAAKLYRRAADGSPVPEFAASLGDTLHALGRLAAAERAWQRAERLERLFAANGGRNLLETAEFDLDHDRRVPSALDRARRGRAERPSVEGDHVLAWALYKNDRCGEARVVSLRSLRLGTLDVDGFYHHSLIEACLGNSRASAVYAEKVRSLDPAYLARAPSARRHSASAG